MNTSSAAASNTLLDRMQYRGDPLADATIARILGPWPAPPAATGAVKSLSAHAVQWQRLASVNRLIESWQNNRVLLDWQPDDPDTPAELAAPLAAYVEAARALPAWADRARIERAEAIFTDHGVLSCTLLFCASLPECYVVPDLSEVLHVTGQLEQRTEYRIRSTAAMIFPVMMQGGLTDPDGGGVAQVLKVRLIHATIRNLILRGDPEDAVAALGDGRHVAGAGVVAPLGSLAAPKSMHQALFAHGWKLGADGLPCGQEELAYTLLTFGYVFLRSMRKLGVGLCHDDELAYLHAWNVVGHLVGIERELMADTMEDAAALFALMQSRGRAHPIQPDPRPELGRTLMQTMEQVIPLRVMKPFPVLMTRHLCGRAAAKDLGLTGRVSWLSRSLFALCLLAARVVDGTVRLVLPEFSIARFITRVVGYQFMTRVLMDQTRPLKLPEHLLARTHAMMAGWSRDPKAPRWMNALEARLTTRGKWKTAARP